MTLPQETKFQAASLVEAGIIAAEVARMLSVSPGYVADACKEFGVDPTQAKLGRQTKYDPELIKLCKKLKRQGKYAREIAEIVNDTTQWEITKGNAVYMTKDVKRPKRRLKRISKAAKELSRALKGAGLYSHHIADQVNHTLGCEIDAKQVAEATKGVTRPAWKDGNTGMPLPPSERDLDVFRVYCDGFKTLEATAYHFGITRERVRQILQKLETRHGMVRSPKPVEMRKCEYCSDEFVRKTRGHSKYCSNECGRKAASVKMRKPGCVSDREVTQTLTCAQCESQFERTNYLMNVRRANYAQAGRPDGKHYCSRECYENRAKPASPKREVQEVFLFQEDTGVFPVPAA